MRQFSQQLRQALRRSEVHYQHLLQIDFEGHSLFLNASADDITYQGKVYRGRHWQAPSEMKITGEPSLNDTNLRLNALVPELMAIPLGKHWMNASVTIWTLFLDDQTQTILGESIIHNGRLSDYSYDESGHELVLVSSSVWADFDKVAGRRTNSASQQRYYPNDKGFDFAPSTRENIPWGRT